MNAYVSKRQDDVNSFHSHLFFYQLPFSGYLDQLGWIQEHHPRRPSQSNDRCLRLQCHPRLDYNRRIQHRSRCFRRSGCQILRDLSASTSVGFSSSRVSLTLRHTLSMLLADASRITALWCTFIHCSMSMWGHSLIDLARRLFSRLRFRANLASRFGRSVWDRFHITGNDLVAVEKRQLGSVWNIRCTWWELWSISSFLLVPCPHGLYLSVFTVKLVQSMHVVPKPVTAHIDSESP